MIRDHFKQAMNQRRVHIAQLEVIREKATRAEAKQLTKRIHHERHQLSVLESIWNVR